MRAVPLALCLVLSTGCLVSTLHPVYDDDTIVFDEGLIGAWENRESEVSVTVARGEWRSYVISFTDRFGTTKFTGHLTAIGTSRFLTVLPQDALEKPAFITATNGLMQIAVDVNGVRVREPDYTIVLRRLNAGKLGIEAATDMKQNVIITGSTSKLRKWLAAALKDEALWADWKTFARSTR